MPDARTGAVGIAIALIALIAAACGGGGASKTATPALSADEASTATVVAAATGTAEAAVSARSTAEAAYAEVTIKQVAIVSGAVPDPVSSMPTFIVRLSIDNETGGNVLFVPEFEIKLADGSSVTYGTYRCSKVVPITAPQGPSVFNVQACATERGAPLPLPDALSLAQGATLVRARLVYENDITGPWFTPGGAGTTT